MMHCSICILFIFLSTTVGYNSIDYNIHGVTSPGWEFVRDLFRDNFIRDLDLGASVAIYYQGKLVVGLSGGWFDKSQTKPYDENVLQLVFSTSKGLVAAAVALAVQRGLIDYSELVTRYWPEYGQNGKENTTVGDILSHRAGLANVSVPLEQFLNWSMMIQTLEEHAPAWPPGSGHSYHTYSYGWLAGELVRRVDSKKRSLGQFIRQEISIPTMTEFYIGLPENQEHRVSPLNLNQNSKDLMNEAINEIVDLFNEPRVHQAEIPAVNGISNAWSVARIYSSLIGDLDNGKYKRLLNENIMKLATKPNTPKTEVDLFAQTYTPLGMGFILFDEMLPEFGLGTFGHFGAGGSIGLAVPSKNFSFAYVMNRLEMTMSGIDTRVKPILTKIAEMIN